MNDRCTPATARRLREQGFPQPVPAPGQVWYGFESRPYFILDLQDKYAMGIYIADAFQTAALPASFIVEKYAYAPTAPDILRELGEDWTMIVAGGGFQIYKHFQDPQYIFPIAANENPAEACAEAWEAKQKR